MVKNSKNFDLAGSHPAIPKPDIYADKTYKEQKEKQKSQTGKTHASAAAFAFSENQNLIFAKKHGSNFKYHRQGCQ